MNNWHLGSNKSAFMAYDPGKEGADFDIAFGT